MERVCFSGVDWGLGFPLSPQCGSRHCEVHRLLLYAHFDQKLGMSAACSRGLGVSFLPGLAQVLPLGQYLSVSVVYLLLSPSLSLSLAHSLYHCHTHSKATSGFPLLWRCSGPCHVRHW